MEAAETRYADGASAERGRCGGDGGGDGTLREALEEVRCREAADWWGAEGVEEQEEEEARVRHNASFEMPRPADVTWWAPRPANTIANNGC